MPISGPKSINVFSVPFHAIVLHSLKDGVARIIRFPFPLVTERRKKSLIICRNRTQAWFVASKRAIHCAIFSRAPNSINDRSYPDRMIEAFGCTDHFPHEVGRNSGPEVHDLELDRLQGPVRREGDVRLSEATLHTHVPEIPRTSLTSSVRLSCCNLTYSTKRPSFPRHCKVPVRPSFWWLPSWGTKNLESLVVPIASVDFGCSLVSIQVK